MKETHPIERRVAAAALLKQMWAQRKLPGHCTKCGRELIDGDCPTCKKRRELRLQKRAQNIALQKTIFAAELVKIREQNDRELSRFRRELNKMHQRLNEIQTKNKRSYHRGFQAGQRSGFQNGRKFQREGAAAEAYREALGQLSKQEAKEINHAYVPTWA
jgi:hypothetical protein